MLQIEGASIAYGHDILFSNFNLQLRRGEIACISGSSGCGKTSLLNAILGFTPLKEGRITVNNIVSDKNSIDLIRKQIAWIPQELALPLEWVKDMIQLPFSLKANRATPFSEMQLFNCFEELGLEEELYYKRVNEISGGQRQRMMIALDSGSTERVLAFLRHQTQKGTAVLAVSHDMDFAKGCDRHIIM